MHGVERLAVSSDPSAQLDREIYCLLGLPVDACDLKSAVLRIRNASVLGKPFFISTPNVNFLILSRKDIEFRQSLLMSDFCPVDGMPLIWIARLLGLPLSERVSGSDLFDALVSVQGQPLSVSFFGGAEGVASEACRRINFQRSGVACAGAVYPGQGSIEEMSEQHLLNEINACRADFLVVALGAKKGQQWLVRNHHRIHAPIRAHLGAVVNFHAGRFRRAPSIWRRSGIEWLWRIWQEPQIWRRYWTDGWSLAALMAFNVLPLLISRRWQALRAKWRSAPLRVRASATSGRLEVALIGDATECHVGAAVRCLKETLKEEHQEVIIDLSDTRVIDQRVLGLLLMVRKIVVARGRFRVVGASFGMRRLLRLNGVEYLME